MRALVDDSIRLVSHRVAEAELSVELQLDADIDRLYGDERRLKQVMLNLLSNAVKFTSPGGRIAICSDLTADGDFRLQVVDNGVGMGPRDIETALLPFGQIQGAQRTSMEGSGLGLPLCRAFCELHGGTLTIESVVNEGTTASVVLSADRLR